MKNERPQFGPHLERRCKPRDIGKLEDIEQKDAVGLIQRVLRERIHIEMMVKRDEGPEARKLMKSARDYLQLLFEEYDFYSSKADHQADYLKAVGTEFEKRELDELKKSLEKQYFQMVDVLKRYEMPLDGMPSLDEIKLSLNPDVCRKIRILQKPSFIMVSPTSIEVKLKALAQHPVEGQGDIDPRDKGFGVNINEAGWNGERAKDNWMAAVVEGVENVYISEKASYSTSPKKIQTQVVTLGNLGFQWIRDLDTYLSLFMKSLTENAHIDTKSKTLLNHDLSDIPHCAQSRNRGLRLSHSLETRACLRPLLWLDLSQK